MVGCGSRAFLLIFSKVPVKFQRVFCYNYPHTPTNTPDLYKITNNQYTRTLIHVPALNNHSQVDNKNEYKLNASNLHTNNFKMSNGNYQYEGVDAIDFAMFYTS
jgi:hypothetical protein